VSFTDRSAGAFGGITESWTYSNRLLGTRVQATSSAGTALDLSYNYPTANDGNISSIVNNVTAGRTQTFTYDSLIRLSTAQSQATSGTNCRGQSFGYDRWGNLLTVTSTQCSSPGLTQTTNGNNQLVGFGYDNSGNMTAEGSNSYGWNGENWLTSFGSVSYNYDGNGLRVKKSTGTLYWRSVGGNILAETDLSGNTTAEYVSFAGRHVARRDSSGNVFYYFTDHLGSSRVITQSTGTGCYDTDFLPFGGERTPLVNTCPQAYKFTGYERDSDSGLDYAIFRYYNSRLGRFMSGDPLAGDTGHPQSLNRYAYVVNNPINAVDPLGAFACLDYITMCAETNGAIGGRGVVLPWSPPNGNQAAGTVFTQSGGDAGEKAYVQQVNAILSTPPPGNWVPAGGDYKGSGCLRDTSGSGDTIWCPSSIQGVDSSSNVIGQNPWGSAAQALKQAAQNAGRAGRYPQPTPAPQTIPANEEPPDLGGWDPAKKIFDLFELWFDGSQEFFVPIFIVDPKLMQPGYMPSKYCPTYPCSA